MSKETGKRPAVPPRKTTIYENYRVLDINGDLLFRTGQSRVNWYLSRDLARQIDSSTIQLTFTNKGTGRRDEPFYLQDMPNKCVVCGVAELLTLHHVVPRQYRQFMEEAVKSHSSHDLLPLCVDCHDRYERHAVQFKQHISLCFDAPLEGLGWIERTDVSKGRRAASALLAPYVDKIPHERLAQLRTIVMEVACQHADLFSLETKECINRYTDSESSSNSTVFPEPRILEELSVMETRVKGPEFRCHGDIVVAAVATNKRCGPLCSHCLEMVQAGIPGLVTAWRKHFINYAQPQHLPDHWAVEYACK
ncbi:hypothetical protein H4R20_000369 [Coemansia guatemalensis]|uniref:HNH nuclease domain-containing protein n=1 Tax=Coemansia guatemalensis TaxID=2761395 RepID=A0A9W8LVI7_9FUNG|nr:hypothetical protein H4R20_000369 [Coemansia guatemalensis]